MTSMNFNTKIATTREQSERLLALGVKPETADMSIVVKDATGHPLSTRPYHDWNTYWKNHGYVIPPWSLSRLLEMMPEIVGELKFKIMYPVVGYFCSETGYFYSEADIFENCIEMIAWLINNGHFNKEYLKQE